MRSNDDLQNLIKRNDILSSFLCTVDLKENCNSFTIKQSEHTLKYADLEIIDSEVVPICLQLTVHIVFSVLFSNLFQTHSREQSILIISNFTSFKKCQLKIKNPKSVCCCA